MFCPVKDTFYFFQKLTFFLSRYNTFQTYINNKIKTTRSPSYNLLTISWSCFLQQTPAQCQSQNENSIANNELTRATMAAASSHRHCTHQQRELPLIKPARHEDWHHISTDSSRKPTTFTAGKIL